MRKLAALALPVFVFAACSSSSSSPGPSDGGTATDAAPDAPQVACAGPCPASGIKYLVVVVMENQTFDNHFGAYCTAGPNPSCNAGPSCCEAAPKTEPSGASPIVLDDKEHGGFLPNNYASCYLDKIDGGKMDRFVTSATCGAPDNFVQSAPSIVQPYWDLAKSSALADRYFQPMAGASSGNDQYFARARYVFTDDPAPAGAVGGTCSSLGGQPEALHKEQTIGDLLTAASVPWTFYAEAYDAQAAAAKTNTCASGDAACPGNMDSFPCVFDPGDDPFEYYASTQDKPGLIRDLSKLAGDLSGGTLPAVSFVKPIGFKSEHPGYGSALSAGPAFVTSIVNQVQASPYASATLVLVTWDEGGGYFDHVQPPPTNTADNTPYGPRVPLLAIGPFAKKNYVSHVVMEHSSIVKFMEWNWLGQKTGQLGARDTNVANIGDMLDPAQTGTAVPAN